MSAPDSDPMLLEAVQRGEDRAWRELIERYQGRLISFARRMLATPGDAEDLVQDTFVGLLRSLPTFDRTRSLETYLFAILRHKLSDYVRRRPKTPRTSLEQAEADDAPSDYLAADTPSDYLSEQEGLSAQRAALVAALRQWVDQCCDQGRFQDVIVVEMLMVLGLRNKDVAADLGLSETGIAGIKFRVLEQWRKATAAAPGAKDWQEADLAANSTLATIWREEGISCPKRSTLGRFLLGVLDDAWNEFIEFHIQAGGCDRCQANLDDLRAEDAADAADAARQRERFFASSVGFLSKRPST